MSSGVIIPGDKPHNTSSVGGLMGLMPVAYVNGPHACSVRQWRGKSPAGISNRS